MLPIRDNTPSRGFAWALFWIVAVNAAMFAGQALLDPRGGFLVGTFGLIPSRFVGWLALGGSAADPMRYAPFVTSIFLHDGWLHLLTNMVYLWCFGRALEHRVGRGTFVGMFLFAGVAAALGQVFAHPHSNAAMIGASGAIAGVLGAYLVYFGRAKITVAFPFLLVPFVIEVRASWFLLAWFAMQVGRGTSDLLSGVNDPGVAWWAHATGFAAGVLAGAVNSSLENLPEPARTPARPRPSMVPAAARRASLVPGNAAAVSANLRASRVPAAPIAFRPSFAP